MVVRMGAARGYGGCNALSSDNDWLTWPGTGRVDFSAGNEGDRALVISEQTSNAGAAAAGTWYSQARIVVICGQPSNWVTYTVKLQPT